MQGGSRPHEANRLWFPAWNPWVWNDFVPLCGHSLRHISVLILSLGLGRKTVYKGAQSLNHAALSH